MVQSGRGRPALAKLRHCELAIYIKFDTPTKRVRGRLQLAVSAIGCCELNEGEVGVLKIKGLVRTFNQARAALSEGFTPEEAVLFADWVRMKLKEIEQICAAHRTKPERLPAQSRMAYQYLKSIDLANLPGRQPGERMSQPGNVKLKNVVKLGDQMAERLWRTPERIRSGIDDLRRIGDDLNLFAGQIEEFCRQGGETPAALDAPSRQVYCWMRFLTMGGNLAAHLDALARARAAAAEWQLRPGQRLYLHMINQASLWRMRRSGDGMVIRVSEGFLYADMPVWQALMKQLFESRCQVSRQIIDEYTATEDFGDICYELESLAAPPAPPARGNVHDLDECFDRVNREYFGGKMARPNLTWNRTLTLRILGHYQPARDRVMISASLDQPEVPAFLLDYVMYHELLHKLHGIMYLNGRRISHSAAFREDERRFAGWREAEVMLSQLSR